MVLNNVKERDCKSSLKHQLHVSSSYWIVSNWLQVTFPSSVLKSEVEKDSHNDTCIVWYNFHSKSWVFQSQCAVGEKNMKFEVVNYFKPTSQYPN